MAKFLQKQDLKSLIGNQSVQATTETSSVYACIKTLAAHNILSVPVLNTKTGNYNGFVDYLDIITFIGSLTVKQKSSFIEELLGEQVVNKQVSEITRLHGLSQNDPFLPIPETSDALVACQYFATMGCHRLPVFNAKKKLIGILTQSDLVRFIDNNADEFDDLMQKQIKDIDIGTSKNLISISPDVNALQAFNIMKKNGINGVPILDKFGHIIGNISASDIKYSADTTITNEYFGLKLFEYLDKPVLKYLHELRDFKQMDVDALCNIPICCFESSTLKHVVARMVKKKIHRIYVISKQAIPLRVISLIDIIKCILANSGIKEKPKVYDLYWI